MQVSGGFQVSVDWCWLVLVGALVGDGSASNDAPWLAIVNRASRREAMSSRSVGKRPHLSRWATAPSSATPAIVRDNHANPATDAVSWILHPRQCRAASIATVDQRSAVM
jgi:hypothetical protein